MVLPLHILRKGKAACLSSHSKQVTVAPVKASVVQVHSSSATHSGLWDWKFGKDWTVLSFCGMSFLCGALFHHAWPVGWCSSLEGSYLSKETSYVDHSFPEPHILQASAFLWDSWHQKFHALGTEVLPALTIWSILSYGSSTSPLETGSDLSLRVLEGPGVVLGLWLMLNICGLAIYCVHTRPEYFSWNYLHLKVSFRLTAKFESKSNCSECDEMQHAFIKHLQYTRYGARH